MKLVDRDYQIFKEIDRWRFCLGRHIKVLADFKGQRACDRRLHVLIQAGYIEREKILYGIPSIYRLTYKAKMLIGANKRHDKVRVDNIAHDIAVIDTAVYMRDYYRLSLSDIITEKHLHSRDGFSMRKHYPDFVIKRNYRKTINHVNNDGIGNSKENNNKENNAIIKNTNIKNTVDNNDETYCVEIEMSMKSKERLNKTLKSNFIIYDAQIWVIGMANLKLFRILEDSKKQYPNISIMNIEDVKNYIKEKY